MCETQPRNRLGHSKWMARLDPPHHSPDQHLVESLSRHAFDGHRTFMLADPSSALIAYPFVVMNPYTSTAPSGDVKREALFLIFIMFSIHAAYKNFTQISNLKAKDTKHMASGS
ncbi:hypothetical protein D5086_022390 [Populus alba]|uniref:Uncharacterized protein n=1 Tax=Populus alba TaxID=43335 RepID=A0ACC4BEX0_POPAL